MCTAAFIARTIAAVATTVAVVVITTAIIVATIVVITTTIVVPATSILGTFITAVIAITEFAKVIGIIQRKFPYFFQFGSVSEQFH